MSAKNFAAFNALITTPGSLSTGIEMPANSRLGVSTDVDIGLGASLITIKGKDVVLIGGKANTVFRLSYGETGDVVKLSKKAVGNVKLYMLDEYQMPYLIGTMTGELE